MSTLEVHNYLAFVYFYLFKDMLRIIVNVTFKKLFKMMLNTILKALCLHN